jgi:hypothetical protein
MVAPNRQLLNQLMVSRPPNPVELEKPRNLKPKKLLPLKNSVLVPLPLTLLMKR